MGSYSLRQGFFYSTWHSNMTTWTEICTQKQTPAVRRVVCEFKNVFTAFWIWIHLTTLAPKDLSFSTTRLSHKMIVRRSSLAVWIGRGEKISLAQQGRDWEIQVYRLMKGRVVLSSLVSGSLVIQKTWCSWPAFFLFTHTSNPLTHIKCWHTHTPR